MFSVEQQLRRLRGKAGRREGAEKEGERECDDGAFNNPACRVPSPERKPPSLREKEEGATSDREARVRETGLKAVCERGERVKATATSAKSRDPSTEAVNFIVKRGREGGGRRERKGTGTGVRKRRILPHYYQRIYHVSRSQFPY